MTVIATRRAYQGGETIEVKAAIRSPAAEMNHGLWFTFTMGSAGGGRSEFGVEVRPESYEEVARRMLQGNREAAIKAFAAATLASSPDDDAMALS